jgi:transcriptional regulator with GAF, ATPase, and Fis domain
MEEENKIHNKKMGDPEIKKLQDTIQQLEDERQKLLNRYKEVEEENKDFITKYVEVEEENNNLANLYVASYQLHSTLDYNEVLRIIIEIIINMVGSDRFGIFLRDEESDMLSIAAAEGIEGEKTKRVKIGEGVIGEVAKTGESFFEEDLENSIHTSELDPIVCIPLKIKEHLIGVIAVFSLFEQKKEKLTRVDFELFSMLAGHAATAIFSSRLYSQSERKLSTIQGFIDLLGGKV